MNAAMQFAVREELARRRLLDYCVRVDPSYETPRHIRLLAEHLERLERVVR